MVLGPLAWRPPEKLAIKKKTYMLELQWTSWRRILLDSQVWALGICTDKLPRWFCTLKLENQWCHAQFAKWQPCRSHLACRLVWFGLQSWQYDFYILICLPALKNWKFKHTNPNIWPPLKHQRNFVILNTSSLVTVSSPVSLNKIPFEWAKYSWIYHNPPLIAFQHGV